MKKRIVLIQGHPDPKGGHFDHALAAAYLQGAHQSGHQVDVIEVANLEFPLLRSKLDWEQDHVPETLITPQKLIADCDHLVLIYPLWLGSMPALLKAFLEQVLRPHFVLSPVRGQERPRRMLQGKSARVVVTMGMPAWFYRWYFRAHSLKSLERNILGFCGLSPIRHTLIGVVEGKSSSKHGRWLDKLRKLGRQAI